VKCIRPTQRGFAAIAAIFLVVVLAALGGFMLTFSNTQQLTSAQDVQGSRAYWAARAGLEWGLVRIPEDPTLCPDLVLTTVVTTTATAALPSSIEGFTIEILCANNVYSEGVNSPRIYSIESRARSTGGAVGSIGYIERSVSASMETP
jgi:MSHA biogenesis protein MshP